VRERGFDPARQRQIIHPAKRRAAERDEEEQEIEEECKETTHKKRDWRLETGDYKAKSPVSSL